MIQALREKVIVKLGNIIEIKVPELSPGITAEVIIIPEGTLSRPFSLSEWIGAAPGSFMNYQEADAFLEKERESWEK